MPRSDSGRARVLDVARREHGPVEIAELPVRLTANTEKMTDIRLDRVRGQRPREDPVTRHDSDPISSKQETDVAEPSRVARQLA